MNKKERVKAVNSLMELVHQYGYANYLECATECNNDPDRNMAVIQEQNNLEKIIRYEIYALIDKLDTKKEEDK